MTEVGHCNKLQVPCAVVSDDGSKPEVLSRIEQATAALTKLKPIWRDNNISLGSNVKLPGRVAQSVGHLTRKSGVQSSIPGLATTFVSPSAFSRRAVVSYWRKYVHEVLVNR